jgi:hypothetical protein
MHILVVDHWWLKFPPKSCPPGGFRGYIFRAKGFERYKMPLQKLGFKH